MYKHILIATDGSDLASKGVVQGLALAEGLGAKATILTVAEPLSTDAVAAAEAAGFFQAANRYDQQIAADMQERLAELEKETEKHSIAIDLRHDVHEHPAEAIISFAKLNDVDLIVMTSHGRRGIQRLVLGSQTSEVLAGSSIPVLVIR